jgi:hypothetical protein
MARRNGKPHASLYDFRDLDLMLRLNEEGEVEAREVSEAIGLGEDGTHAVGIRLAWMRRFGMVEFDPEKKLWRLSEGGERVTKAKLRAAAARSLIELPDEAMVEVVASVTSHYRHAENPMIAHMLRREFAYGTRPR